jgi:hypothetical protein
LQLIRHGFGSEGPVYVRSYLKANKAFGRRLGALLQHRDIESGTTWSLVPVDSSPQERVDFEEGLFPDAGPPAKVGDGYFVPKFRPDSNAQILTALSGLLARHDDRSYLVCVESALVQRRDSKSEGKEFYCGEDVYWYERPDAPVDMIARLLGGATWQRPNIGMVTALPDPLTHLSEGELVSVELLEEMAASASALILGAWDAESFLFWEQSTLDDS